MLKGLLSKPVAKKKRTPPQMLGKWKITQNNETLARVRVVLSMDNEFFKGQRLFQVINKENRYNNVAFVTNDGGYKMFSTYENKPEADVLHNFIQLLEAGGTIEDITLVEVHQDASFHSSVLGKAIAKWQESEKDITN